MTPSSIDPASAARIADPEWLSLAWYGQTLGWLCASKGLLHVSPERGVPDLLAALPGAASGHLVACSPDVVAESPAALSRCIVVGGPCLGDCMRGPTLEALYDTVGTMLTAKALGADALLYLGDREEALGAGGEGKWLQLGERFERWVLTLASAMGFERLSVVRTSSPSHEAALVAAGNPARALDRDRIDRAFHLGSPAPRSQEAGMGRVTERVIEAHLPQVVARHMGREAPVLVAESLPQAGLFQLARELAAGEGAALWFVGQFPAPAPSARSRMYRAETWDKAPAAQIEKIVAGVPALHPYARQFFACWLTPELRHAAAEAARSW